jgi:predicted DNA-binding transcriptional regulator
MDIKTGAKLLKSIEKGDIEYVKNYFLDKTNTKILIDGIILAAKKGKVDIFKYLLNKTENFKIIPNIDLLLRAKILQTGNISIISILTKKLLKNNLLKIGWTEIVNTAAGDNLEALIYIIEKASEVSGPLFLNNLEIYYTAIIQNILLNRIKNVDILKYLLGETVNDKKGNQVKISVPIVPDYDHVSNTIVPQATYNLEIFKYLFEYSKTKGIEINWKLTIQSAVKNNDLKIVKYVTEKLIESGEKLPKTQAANPRCSNCYPPYLCIGHVFYALGTWTLDQFGTLHSSPILLWKAFFRSCSAASQAWTSQHGYPGCFIDRYCVWL